MSEPSKLELKVSVISADNCQRERGREREEERKKERKSLSYNKTKAYLLLKENNPLQKYTENQISYLEPRLINIEPTIVTEYDQEIP